MQVVDKSQHNALPSKELWRALGLQVFPFAMHTEYRAYALPQIWFRLLRSLQAFLRKDQLIAIFYGPEGIGKRSLLLQWLRFGRVKMPQCHIIGRLELQPMQFITKVAESFELSLNVSNSISTALENLQHALEGYVGVRLLVIECVEKLPLATSAIIAKLIADQSERKSINLKIITTLDSAKSQVQDLFADAASTQEILRLNMQRYTLDDTREYILHRLHAAGLPTQRELDEVVVQKIYSDSNGIPDKINKIAATYSPKQLLKPLPIADAKDTNFVSKLRKLFSFYNVGAYAVGLLMSLSIAVMVISRPNVNVGSGFLANSVRTHLQKVADAGMSGVHADYDFFDSENLLNNGPSGRYALILASFTDSKQARAFVRRSNLSGKSYYWLHKHNGKHWTAVLLGTFKTHKQAELAIQKLPQKLADLQPRIQKLPRKQNI